MNNASDSIKAEEVILQQPELITDIAGEVSKELKLKDINNTLGKDIIRYALRSNDFNKFKDECSDYGLKSNDFLYSIYKKVNDTKSSIQSMETQRNSSKRGEFNIFGDIEHHRGINQKEDDEDEQEGGLIIKKSNKSNKKEITNSTLGLDNLSNQIKLQNNNKMKRSYRERVMETPSHTPGLDHDAEERIIKKRRELQHRGIVINKDNKDNNSNNKDHHHHSNHHHSHHHHNHSHSRDNNNENNNENNDEIIHRSGIGIDENEWERPERLSTIRSSSSSSLHSNNNIDSVNKSNRNISTSTPLSLYSTSSSNSNNNKWIMSSSIRETSGNDWEKTPIRKDGNNNNTWEQMNKSYNMKNDDFDRSFYLNEDAVDIDSYNPFIGDENKLKEKEKQMEKQRALGEKKPRGLSALKSMVLKDQERWERNRLIGSGIVEDTGLDNDEDDGSERVSIIVHAIKPPFLDGRVTFTTQKKMVSTVKDESSDFAKLAKNGSPLKENSKGRQRFWELNGSKMGNLLGLKEIKEQDEIQEEQLQEGKFREGAKYGDHMLGSNEAVSEFAKTHTIKEQRESLPVYSVKEEIINIIRENQIVVVVGETGSGKTTQLTQFVYESGFGNNGKIGCTQPRRVAAMSVAERVANEVGCEIGSIVGYAIRFEDRTSKQTKIKYMTDGVLLRESLKDPLLEDYSVIIMDEAHERSLNTDVLFGILRTIIQKRKDLKLIVTSATMDSDKFSNFFGGVPVYHIPGRTFPVEVYHTKSPCEDYVDAAVKQVLTIHCNPSQGDILVFMTGQADIECTCELLAEKMAKLENLNPLLILPMYSQLPADLQARIFQKAPEGSRKCIVSTNVAETSLTVDGIRYVVDSGYCKVKVYNPSIGMDALQITPISQASANQRKGRAGRTGVGYCYRLYTELMFANEMLPNQIPEIQRTNLGNIVLLLKSLGVTDLLKFPFMDSPPQANILQSMYQLWVLGALDNTGELTELGKYMVELPLDPPLSKMVVNSVNYKCSSEIITIVSMLSVPPVFYRPKDNEADADSKREKFFVPESDHLTLLNTYNQWSKNNYSSNWCEQNFINPKSMKKAAEIREQIIDIMRQLKLPIETCGTEWDVVRETICGSYFHNAAKLKGIGEYVNLLSNIPCNLHPGSSLYGLGYTPDYVVYHELVMTTKEYMHCVTAVDGEWLAAQGDKFFSINDPKTRLEKKKIEKEQLKEMEEEERASELRKKMMEKSSMPPPKSKRSQIATPGKSNSNRRYTPRRIGL